MSDFYTELGTSKKYIIITAYVTTPVPDNMYPGLL